jgi:glycerol uptake facilitator-like aquaporin
VGSAIGAEVLLTAILVFVVFAATDKSRGASTPHLSALAPFAIGVTVFLCHIVAVPIDGCSVNPARSFGAAVVSGVWAYQWVFWVGPLAAGVAVGLLYENLAFRAPRYVGPQDGEGPDEKPGAAPGARAQEFAV